MLRVILDTSSLIELALAARRERPLEEPSIDFYRSFGGLRHAIEALVLYDEIAVDAPSIRRNLEKLPELDDYVSWCTPVAVETGAESRIYEAVLNECVPHIEIGTDSFDPFRMHTQDWMAAEVGAKRWYPSARWRDIEAELTDSARVSAEAMRKRFEGQIPYSGAALLQLLRTFYYDRLPLLSG